MADATQLKSLEDKIETLKLELFLLRTDASQNRLEFSQKITQMQQTLQKITQDLSQQTQMLQKIMGLLNSRQHQSHNTISRTSIPNILYKDLQPAASSSFQQPKATANQNEVSLRIAGQVLRTAGNVFEFVFSPISIQIMLSIVAVGSTGSTRYQLFSFLKASSVEQLIESSSEIISSVFADGSEKGGPTLRFANAVWVDRRFGLKQCFKRILDSAFKAETSQLDFRWKDAEATNEVNEWVQKATNGLIKDIIPLGSIYSVTELVLANALYFKGDWNPKFDSSSTKEDEFHLLYGSTIRVPFMRSWAKQFVAVFDDFKVLQLPYMQGLNKANFSMYIFLPNAKDGLAALVHKMGTEPGFLDRYLPPKFEVEIGFLAIPKFKISSDFEASFALRVLGLSSLFSSDADLSEMVEYRDTSRNERLRVSNIYHKSFIDVNEEGTEAVAAASAASLFGSTMSSSDNGFVADHPFLFMIREDVSGVVLFIGQVLQPLQTGNSPHCLNHQPQFFHAPADGDTGGAGGAAAPSRRSGVPVGSRQRRRRQEK